MLWEQEESSDEDDDLPGFDKEESKEQIFGGQYKEGEEEFKGHIVQEEQDSVDEDAIF